MSENNNFSSIISGLASKDYRQKITGKNLLVKRLFQFLYQKSSLQQELLLSTAEGLVLHGTFSQEEDDLCGYRLDIARLADKEGSLCRLLLSQEYFALAPGISETNPAVSALKTDMASLLEILDGSETDARFLLRSLDSMRNAISIYDSDAHLIFANEDFCRCMHIGNRKDVIGMYANDILQYANIKIHSMENNSNQMKMMDVLKDGQEALNWEVRLESQTPPNKVHVVTNDMYPVLDKEGRVEGMVELMRSRQQDMKRTKKMVGLTAEYTFDDIVGASPIIREKIQLAKEFADSPFNFLITGESGVGKELFAQSIHNRSRRREGPFVALNCANFSEGLIESELFGYVGGAFTGASKNGQMGKFELADGGTLFLDEIGELPYHFQSKLLRVLETWMVTRIGSSRQIPVDVRVIAATNRDLNQMAAQGLFRQDLYYRLQVLNVDIPPLRERREDIPLLAKAFLTQAADLNCRPPQTLSQDAQAALMEYDWPGNVRELRNVINRATILSKTDVIQRSVLEASIYSKGFIRKANSDTTPQERIHQRRTEVEHAYVNLLQEALDVTSGNKKKAAQLLGISRKTFYRMLDKYCSEEKS